MELSHSQFAGNRAVVVGAGIGGLAAALRLVSAGADVTLCERHSAPGGKMRVVDTPVGPVDAGPTVLTLRGVFDDLFQAANTRLDAHVTLIPQEMIARHFWPDGSSLDLFSDQARSYEAVRSFAGQQDAEAFRRFCADARRLFAAFDGPVMRFQRPSLSGILKRTVSDIGLVSIISPLATLHQSLARRFSDPRLVQLFGRYATYVGGDPYRSPAILSLIWQAEASGVWAVEGGMHRLALAITELCQTKGVRFHFNTQVDRIEAGPSGVRAVVLESGARIATDTVVFNGDPRALALGHLGKDAGRIARTIVDAPRSLSARVWSFAAQCSGPELALHNVFFTEQPKAEFDALRDGQTPESPTLYVCAQDRAGPNKKVDGQPERFEIIANAPPLTVSEQPEPEFDICRRITFKTLERFGMRFAPEPGEGALTTPAGFERLFPGSAGSLYGQSPHGMMSTFRRPQARTSVRGLYLVGGGVHPGAGVPMAALSARHAVEAIMQDHALT
ncbi:phytoene desaturase [Sulfitobacter sp. BDSS02]|nr:phytoene desaturase [Sulfitobacter sp. BDSS02]MBR9849599.1 phytoene desaturase [Paracoccaceae bacterium]